MPVSSNYIPVYIAVDGLRIVVAGAGRIATRKLADLVGQGACIEVYGNTCSPEIKEWAQAGWLVYHQGLPDINVITANTLLINTIADSKWGQICRQRCNEVGALLNDATNAEAGNCIMPATVRCGQALLAIATGGASPRLTKLLKEDWQRRYGDLGQVLDDMKEMRALVRKKVDSSHEREAFWKERITTATLLALEKGKWPDVKGEIEDAIGRLGLKS